MKERQALLTQCGECLQWDWCIFIYNITACCVHFACFVWLLLTLNSGWERKRLHLQDMLLWVATRTPPPCCENLKSMLGDVFSLCKLSLIWSIVQCIVLRSILGLHKANLINCCFVSIGERYPCFSTKINLGSCWSWFVQLVKASLIFHGSEDHSRATSCCLVISISFDVFFILVFYSNEKMLNSVVVSSCRAVNLDLNTNSSMQQTQNCTLSFYLWRLHIFSLNLATHTETEDRPVSHRLSPLLSALPAAATQGELPDSGDRQGEEALPQGDEGRGRGGDVVRVWRNSTEMVREPSWAVRLYTGRLPV